MDQELSCNKCGKCCQAIVLTFTKKEVKSKRGPDVAFILKNWKRISKEKAIEINPYLKNWLNIKCKFGRSMYFYKCLKYDPKSKLCLVHDKRPNVCSGYPIYKRGTVSEKETFYTEKCGFNIKTK